jgi:hypothetical protein
MRPRYHCRKRRRKYHRFTDDFDSQIQAGNTGYAGTDPPDIGADEITGIEVVPPTITYTALTIQLQQQTGPSQVSPLPMQGYK